MKTLYFIRHGQSEANAGGISQPEREIALSTIGKQQAQELLQKLPPKRAVFISEMRRTAETAAPYCDYYGISPQILPELNEFSCLSIDLIRGMNGAERRPLGEAYWQRAQPDECTGMGADSFVAFNQRIEAFFQLYPKLPDGCLLFGHGIWLAMLLWKQLGFAAKTSSDMQAFRRWQLALPMPNAAIWQLSGDSINNLRLLCLP